MCGIYGTILKERQRIDVGVMRALTLANRERGKESLGFFDSNKTIFKRGKDPIDVLATDDCTEFLDNAESNSWFLVGHTRYSTRGTVCDANTHPFQYGEVIGSHNGIIDAPQSYSVDSEYAIDLLNKHESNYQAALENQWGYWTLSWYDSRKEELFVSMHDNTCGIVRHRGAWYFSSDPDHLHAVLGGRDTIVLSSGDTVSFDKHGRMKWRKKFTSGIEYSYKKDYRTGGRRGGKSSMGYYTSTSGTTSATGGTGTGNYRTNTTGSAAGGSSKVNISDPDGFMREYDDEFRKIWEEYAAQYEQV